MAFGKASAYSESENLAKKAQKYAAAVATCREKKTKNMSGRGQEGKATAKKVKKEGAVCQEKEVYIPEIKGRGFDMVYVGEGAYIYQEGRWKEELDREKIKKIKRRIVDKVYKSTPVEALQFAFNNNLICEKLFE